MSKQSLQLGKLSKGFRCCWEFVSKRIVSFLRIPQRFSDLRGLISKEGNCILTISSRMQSSVWPFDLESSFCRRDSFCQSGQIPNVGFLLKRPEFESEALYKNESSCTTQTKTPQSETAKNIRIRRQNSLGAPQNFVQDHSCPSTFNQVTPSSSNLKVKNSLLNQIHFQNLFSGNCRAP